MKHKENDVLENNFDSGKDSGNVLRLDCLDFFQKRIN